ncbi:hypothetical protein DRN74_02800 [Candidatus Micrarchaeota archaeon]|nr:MAG: hypothetical protein DRN74_02800 [Candidatus Micrarchaeota archaeon]
MRFALWLKRYEKEVREEAVKKSRAVLGGKFAEQMAAYLPGFDYDPTEARFIGSPIDFVVFDGLAKGDLKKIVFVEVKTGSSSLSARENAVKNAVKNKRVEWKEMRIGEI